MRAHQPGASRQPLQAKKGNTQPPRADRPKQPARRRKHDESNPAAVREYKPPADDEPPRIVTQYRQTERAAPAVVTERKHPSEGESGHSGKTKHTTTAPANNRRAKPQHGGQSTAEQSRRAEIRPPPPSTAAPNRTTTKTPKTEIKPTHGSGANHHAPKLPARASQRNHTRRKDSERGADQHNGGAPLQPTQNKPKQPDRKSVV